MFSPCLSFSWSSRFKCLNKRSIILTRSRISLRGCLPVALELALLLIFHFLFLSFSIPAIVLVLSALWLLLLLSSTSFTCSAPATVRSCTTKREKERNYREKERERERESLCDSQSCRRRRGRALTDSLVRGRPLDLVSFHPLKKKAHISFAARVASCFSLIEKTEAIWDRLFFTLKYSPPEIFKCKNLFLYHEPLICNFFKTQMLENIYYIINNRQK